MQAAQTAAQSYCVYIHSHVVGVMAQEDGFVQTINSKSFLIFFDIACLLQTVHRGVNAIFAGDIHALKSCGATYQAISHVTRVKLSRGSFNGCNETMVSYGSGCTEKPLQRRLASGATLTAARATERERRGDIDRFAPRTQRCSPRPTPSPCPGETLKHSTCLTLAGSLFHG